MKKYLTPLVVAFILAVINVKFSYTSSTTIQVLTVLVNALVGAIVSSLYEFIDTHEQGLKMWLQSNIIKREKIIRLSFSYLYRIQIDGKYLLIKGNKLNRQYQPVGGVYQYYDEAKPFLNSIHYIPDSRMENPDNDLRINLKGKYLLKFIDWFISMKDREYDPTREFYEELIETNLLPSDLFRNLEYRKIHVHNDGITFSSFHQCDEWIYSDIFELKLNSKQKDAIKDAVKLHPNELCLASDIEIRQMRINSLQNNIGNNAVWIIE